jgi:hypothetical protein
MARLASAQKLCEVQEKAIKDLKKQGASTQHLLLQYQVQAQNNNIIINQLSA